MLFDNSIPIYLQIENLMEQQILDGSIAEGERVLSVREYAKECGVNPNTIQRAYSNLQEQEILVNKRGVGYFVESAAVQKIKNHKIKRFREQILPDLFQTLQLLDVSPQLLAEYYLDYLEGDCDEKN